MVITEKWQEKLRWVNKNTTLVKPAKGKAKVRGQYLNVLVKLLTNRTMIVRKGGNQKAHTTFLRCGPPEKNLVGGYAFSKKRGYRL